ncbi:MAG: MMPL family transporter [Hyphomicrobium sp.]
MVQDSIEKIGLWCYRKPWVVLALATSLTLLSGFYVLNNFKINTDTSNLISSRLAWRQKEIAFDKAFPQLTKNIIIVIDAETSDLADEASQKLANELSKDKTHFEQITLPGSGDFFEKNGLLYLKSEEIQNISDNLISSQGFLLTLASDPSLRGFSTVLGYIAQGIQKNSIRISDYIDKLSSITNDLEDIVEEKKSSLNWNALFIGEKKNQDNLRRFIFVKPILDFSSLQPGLNASNAIRSQAKSLGLNESSRTRVRLTGAVPMADEEFGTLQEGALPNFIITVGLVILILWFALKSLRLIIAVIIALFCGLILTAAAGLLLVGAFNPISVAFAVLFVGIGVDFGIQYTVKYREERHKCENLERSIINASRIVGKPLAIAAAATTAGFFSFLMTDYKGVSELGFVAGVGMIIAFVTSISILPSLFVLLKPSGEKSEIGYRNLVTIDLFMSKYRWPLMIVTFLAVLTGLPKLSYLEFDFNPLNLRSKKVESISTVLDLMDDPNTTPDKISILCKSLKEAKSLSRKFKDVKEVKFTRTLDDFIPKDQDKKINIIKDTRELLYPSLYPVEIRKKSNEDETIYALRETSNSFLNIQTESKETDLIMKRLGSILLKLSELAESRKQSVEISLFDGFKLKLKQIRKLLEPYKVTQDNLPIDLKEEWITKDGQARIEITPRVNTKENAAIKQFAEAVLKVTPEATGSPILIQQSANAVVTAFIQAGLLALSSIAILLYLSLRRIFDVLVTLVPLLLASIVTLELSVVFNMPLNFANIIALPLLLGVGVAFKIYYVMAWRSGVTYLLASPLTRAVLYSAMTTATAFGSLWFSNHPGTSSMGKLLALSLVTTLAAAVLFQPILMGPAQNHTK